jgi:hypothetical protein
LAFALDVYLPLDAFRRSLAPQHRSTKLYFFFTPHVRA